MVHTTAGVTLAGLLTLGPAPAGRETYGARPHAAVPVGANWKIDMGPLVKDFTRTGRFAVDENLVTGTGRLSKASPLSGSQFGDLIYRLEIPIQALAFTPGAAKQAVLAGSRGTFDL